jgi:hypothetical protein
MREDEWVHQQEDQEAEDLVTGPFAEDYLTGS